MPSINGHPRSSSRRPLGGELVGIGQTIDAERRSSGQTMIRNCLNFEDVSETNKEGSL